MIGWHDEEGKIHRGPLFGAFAALARGEAWSFPALRAHQREPWHAFTVQVAALALIRAGLDTLPTDEAAWAELLVALTPGQPGGEAWQLVVDDWSMPALLQPPLVAPSNRADYKSRLPTPDALDMLVTAKNHDVKQERMAEATDEDWLFALVTLQTYEGFLGAGNYGISRMNGGFASRMSLGLRPAGGAAAAFRRDVRRLVADARARPDRCTGIPLLWIEPWDGMVSLAYPDLDELYVEICRRVRLHRRDDAIEALAAGSKCARVAAKGIGGNTRDPWAPLAVDTKKGSETEGKLVSVTASGAGFGYRRMARLLDDGKVTPPLLVQPHDSDDATGMAIVAAALVRGQGKTEGLHRRTIPTSRLEEIGRGGHAPLDRIGFVAGTRAKEAGEAGKRLRRALISLVQGGPDQARLDDDAAKKKTDRWLDRFDRVIDRDFFDGDFWSEAAADDGNHRLAWRERLRAVAGTVFETAADAAPRTEIRRVRARARARALLDGQMRKWVEEVRHGE